MNKIMVAYHNKCGSSLQLYRFLNKHCKEYDIEYVHVDSDPHRLQKLRVKATPETLILDKEENVIKRIVGFHETIKDKLKEYV